MSEITIDQDKLVSIVHDMIELAEIEYNDLQYEDRGGQYEVGFYDGKKVALASLLSVVKGGGLC